MTSDWAGAICSKEWATRNNLTDRIYFLILSPTRKVSSSKKHLRYKGMTSCYEAT